MHKQNKKHNTYAPKMAIFFFLCDLDILTLTDDFDLGPKEKDLPQGIHK